MVKGKNNQEAGTLTVEASLAVPLFIFFFLFVLSFVQVFAAQSIITQAMAQAGQSMSVQSYAAKELKDTLWQAGPFKSVLDWVSGTDQTTSSYFTADESEWYKEDEQTQEMAKKLFIAYFGGGSTEKANEFLKALNVENGLAGLDFKDTKVINGDLYLHISYSTDMRYMQFFGLVQKLQVEKEICVRLWSEGGIGGVGAGL